MKIKIILIPIFFLFLACKDKKTEYYPNGGIWKEYHLKDSRLNGKFKEFYTNGNVKELKEYKDGKEIDSSIFFYKDIPNKVKYIDHILEDSIKRIFYNVLGHKESEGYIVKNRPLGKWVFYNEDNLIKNIREYKRINGSDYINQEWYLNQNEDTIYEQSYFFEIVSKDTFFIKEDFKAALILKVPFYKNNDSEIEVVVASPESKYDFKADFSNVKNVRKKSFYNLSKDVKNQKWFSGINGNFKHIAAFGKKINHTGNQIIRGYILEYTNDSINRKERKMYFEKTIFVKDSL